MFPSILVKFGWIPSSFNYNFVILKIPQRVVGIGVTGLTDPLTELPMLGDSSHHRLTPPPCLVGESAVS